MANKTKLKVLVIVSLIGATLSIILYQYGIWPFPKVVEIATIEITSDKDKDGITDLQDIVEGARLQIKKKPRYKSIYYKGGYPPQSEGVCTDLIWRAFKNAGYDLKALVDEDIKKAENEYYRVLEFGGPDPNIDFRRVQNLAVFLKRNAQSLTTIVDPTDINNLVQWQAGDIVCFKNHIGIVSNKRLRNGVPLMIHHSYRYPNEGNYLINSKQQITGHYRYPKQVKQTSQAKNEKISRKLWGLQLFTK
ncbi:DUF1287 domain-containing protein [Clostridium sp. 'deep sea']|uniref:DUF1287 domain-containing protein n=1 Tax=Clostridium sp. 'deep sea' TaxID=2779445 RepID=UPI00189659E6|nr:DUF1287 domain-containing protein [Clostridium sp. 'deep sea']QOR34017.1 DUF1287 domain-containing protein [Clostridium sp. 'deep sea']